LEILKNNSEKISLIVASHYHFFDVRLIDFTPKTKFLKSRLSRKSKNNMTKIPMILLASISPNYNNPSYAIVDYDDNGVAT